MITIDLAPLDCDVEVRLCFVVVIQQGKRNTHIRHWTGLSKSYFTAHRQNRPLDTSRRRSIVMQTFIQACCNQPARSLKSDNYMGD
ncbi:hypothetical protein D3C76_881210 [compost metagenome]